MFKMWNCINISVRDILVTTNLIQIKCYKTFSSYSHTCILCKGKLSFSEVGMLKKKPNIVAHFKGAIFHKYGEK